MTLPPEEAGFAKQAADLAIKRKGFCLERKLALLHKQLTLPSKVGGFATQAAWP